MFKQKESTKIVKSVKYGRSIQYPRDTVSKYQQPTNNSSNKSSKSLSVDTRTKLIQYRLNRFF